MSLSLSYLYLQKERHSCNHIWLYINLPSHLSTNYQTLLGLPYTFSTKFQLKIHFTLTKFHNFIVRYNYIHVQWGGLHLLALVITKYLSDVFGVIHVLAISFLQITAFIRNKSFHLFIILTLLLLLHITLNPTLPYFYKTNNTIYNTDIFKQRRLYKTYIKDILFLNIWYLPGLGLFFLICP